MFNISLFLEKFSKNIQSGQSNKIKIIEIIKKHTQVELSIKSLEIKNTTVYITASPSVKNKLFIYKNKILEEVTKSVSIKITNMR